MLDTKWLVWLPNTDAGKSGHQLIDLQVSMICVVEIAGVRSR